MNPVQNEYLWLLWKNKAISQANALTYTGGGVS